MSKTLELRFLGPIEIRRDDVPVTEIQANKTLALLSYLVVTARPHPRPALAGLLWGGMSEARARDSLSKALSSLRRVAGEHLTITRQMVTFNPDSDFWLDVAAFEAGVNDNSIEQLETAVQLYKGDFLEGFYVRKASEFEVWVLAQQARLKELALRVLHTLAAHFAEEDNAGWTKAIDYTSQLLALEPWREEAHRQMMRLLAFNGQRGAALIQYEKCRQILADELSIEPGAETTMLYEQIRDGELSRGAGEQGSRGAGEQGSRGAGEQGSRGAGEQGSRGAGEQGSRGATEPSPLPLRPSAPLPESPLRPSAPLPDSPLRSSAPPPDSPLPPNQSVFSHHLPASQARFPSKLVGRTAEMKALGEVWQRASQGSGQMVLVEGEPGIGKTRLVEELLSEVFGSATILRVKCPEMSDPLAYTLFVGPLRQAFGEDILPDLSDTWLVELSRLFPDVQERYPDLAHPPQLDLATERRRLFDAVGAILRTLTFKRPLLLFLDDLQWADATSLALLSHLADLMIDTPMLVIGTFRPNEVGADHLLLQTQSVWQRLSRLTKLQLSALTMVGVTQLLQELTSWPGEDPSFGVLLNRETQGNPLFLVETIASLRDEGRLPQSAEAWRRDFQADQLTIPSQVQIIIENRLNRLDDMSRQIITGVAALRNSFSLGIVMTIAEASESEILDSLETLLGSGLLIEQGGDTLTFSHDKIREVAYDSLSQLRRRRLHQRAAEGIEMINRDRTDSVADQLAYHFERAGLRDKAWSYHIQAGHRARAQYAHEAAVYHYQRAVTLAPDEVTVAQAKEQIKLYEGLGEILQALGRYTEAEETYGAMLAAASLAEDTVAQVRAWNQLGLTQWWLENYQAALESEIHAEKIARAVGQAAQIALIKVLAIKAWALVYLGEIEAALVQSEAAVSLGVSIDPQPFLELAESFFVLGRVHISLRKYEQSADHLQQALTYFRKVGQRRKGAEVWSVLGGVVGELTGFEKGLAISQEALSEAREIGHRLAEILCLQNLAYANLRLGHYQAAEADLRLAIALAEKSEAHYDLSVTYANLAEACLGQDRIAEAAEIAQLALTLGQNLKQSNGVTLAWRSLGLVSAQSGDPINIKGQSSDAATCFAKSQQIFRETDELINQARLLRDWATYELRQGNWSRGEAKWNEAKGIFEASGLIGEVSLMADLPHVPPGPTSE